jgi:hypothetical protein
MKLLLDAVLNPLAKISNPRFPELKGKTAIDVARELVSNQEHNHYIGNSKTILDMLEQAAAKK